MTKPASRAKKVKLSVLELAAKKVPTNWCDALLTGPDGIGPPPYDCRHIEKLLRGIQDRIRNIEVPK